MKNDFDSLNFPSFDLVSSYSLIEYMEICRRIRPDDDWVWWWLCIEVGIPFIGNIDKAEEVEFDTKLKGHWKINRKLFFAIPAPSLGEMIRELQRIAGYDIANTIPDAALKVIILCKEKEEET